MEKIWAKDVKEAEKVKSTFLVARKAVPTAKSGKTYLAVTLQDKTGELEARAFDKVEELAATFEEKDYVEVEGLVGTFQGRPQLRIETAAKVDPATLEASEFVFVPPPEPKKPERTGFGEAEEALWKELQGLVEAIADEHVKDIVKSFLLDEDLSARLRRAPAAKTVHHAYPGGLLEHTVSCLKLAHRLADHYPQVDRDLLVAGAFLHDIGKVRELSYGGGTEYTDEGRLVGHLVMTAQWIHDKARRVGASKDLEHHLVHIVLSHHGKKEYGSPKEPATLEAALVHYLDELDSRVNSWLNLMGRDGGNRRWTDAQNIYGQHIWRGTLPTVQAEKKGPPAELMTPVIYVPRENQGGGQRQGGNGGGGNSKKKAPRPPREPRAEASARPEGAPGEAPAEQKAEGAPPAERPPRPPRPERPDRGPRGPGGPGGPGERGDRKPRYTGPRLPGDKGPQFRPAKKDPALTHNPFAALAQKLEGGPAEGAAPAEPAAEAPPPAAAEAPPPAAVEVAPPAAPEAAAPQETAPPGDAGGGQA
ncbi:MAG: HD domain-containing protein [Deltaproteobacteria bacterium]|nr:HD domain-containing protein [Deltaproteobacteria bacterium]